MREKLSIVIPVLNEAAQVDESIYWLRQVFDGEIVIVDGGSQDDTVDRLARHEVTVVTACGGRGRQMNIGANEASGDTLLFLHFDTKLEAGFLGQVQAALREPEVVGGAFQFRIAGPSWSYRVLEVVTNARSLWFQCPYGDQGLFLTRSCFDQVGGFPEMPLLEDYEMVRKLRKIGKVVTIDMPATTSERRWKHLGVVRTTAINWWVMLSYWFGVPADQLAALYRRHSL